MFLALGLNVSSQSMDGIMVLYNETNREVMELKDVANDFLLLIDGTKTINQIAEELAETYNVDSMLVLNDLSVLTKELESAGFVVINSKPFEGVMRSGN